MKGLVVPQTHVGQTISTFKLELEMRYSNNFFFRFTKVTARYQQHVNLHKENCFIGFILDTESSIAHFYIVTTKLLSRHHKSDVYSLQNSISSK